jgi:hypothetical protein
MISALYRLCIVWASRQSAEMVAHEYIGVSADAKDLERTLELF